MQRAASSSDGTKRAQGLCKAQMDSLLPHKPLDEDTNKAWEMQSFRKFTLQQEKCPLSMAMYRINLAHESDFCSFGTKHHMEYNF